jgi:hypothetical protein
MSPSDSEGQDTGSRPLVVLALVLVSVLCGMGLGTLLATAIVLLSAAL